MIILKCRTAERPIAGRRAFNLPQGMRARLFRRCRPFREELLGSSVSGRNYFKPTGRIWKPRVFGNHADVHRGSSH